MTEEIDFSSLGWDGLITEILNVETLKAQAEQALKDSRRGVEAELEPARKTLQDLQQQAATLRETLKRHAVETIVRAANGDKTIGVVRLPYKPKVRVLDAIAAAVLLDGVMLVGPNGETRPLVEWRPVIDEDAARLLIESLEGIKPLRILRPGENIRDFVGAIDNGAVVGLTDEARNSFTSPQLLDREARRNDRDTVRGWTGAIVLTRKDNPESYVLQLDLKALREETPAVSDDTGVND